MKLIYDLTFTRNLIPLQKIMVELTFEELMNLDATIQKYRELEREETIASGQPSSETVQKLRKAQKFKVRRDDPYQ